MPDLEPLDGLLDPALIGPLDGRVQEIRTTRFPWNTIVHLCRDFGDGACPGCSGIMTGPTRVLTAAHCLWSAARKAAPARILVMPGRRDRKTLPYGAVPARDWWVPAGFVEGRSPAWDWGLVRLGRAVELEQVEPMIESITESVLSNSGALLTLLRIKNKDDYTFLHSVSVGTLMIAFCRSVGLDRETIRLAGLGGLLHDTGKALVPDAILNKPGRLTEEEFDIIRRHPRDGFDILSRTEGIGEIPLDITLHHHERVDGSGYPNKLNGDTISTMARMAAIVDVYDAITADRCYHKGMAPTDALRKIFEWSKYHFDPKLVQAFMRCVGIYPVGTLVLLESGKLGVVIEQHDSNLLTPKIRVMFSSKSNTYLQPEVIDLSRPLGFGGGDRIVRHEAPEKWGINPLRFM